jgi:ParB-like chromosome segregation protein Spo0J
MPNSPQPKTWRDVLPIHPAAELFPRMSESELRELGADIKKNGMTSPILLWLGDDGNYSLLDGRNRLDAMELVGLKTVDKNGKLPKQIAPGIYDALGTAGGEQTKLYRHADPYNLVLSLNIHRRHLTEERRRELIAKIIKAKPEASDRSTLDIVAGRP